MVCPTAIHASPTTIVAFGDSTTAPRTKVVTYSDQLGTRLGDAVTILNKGVPAHTTEHALGRFRRDVIDPKPDIVIVQFGINDSAINVWDNPPKTEPRVSKEAYEANLRKFVRESKAAGAQVILMTPNQLRWTSKLRDRYGKPPYNPEDERGFNLLLTEYAGIVRKVASEEGAELVDVFALYDSWEKENGKSCSELIPDGMHPNTGGHTLVADALEPIVRRLIAGR